MTKFNQNNKTQRIESTETFRVDQQLLLERLEARKSAMRSSSPPVALEHQSGMATADRNEGIKPHAKSPAAAYERPLPGDEVHRESENRLD